MSYMGFDLKNLKYGILSDNFLLRDSENKSLGTYETYGLFDQNSKSHFTYIRTDKCQWPFYEKINLPYSVHKDNSSCQSICHRFELLVPRINSILYGIYENGTKSKHEHGMYIYPCCRKNAQMKDFELTIPFEEAINKSKKTEMVFEHSIRNTENVIMSKKLSQTLTVINKCEIKLSKESKEMIDSIIYLSVGADSPHFFESKIGINFDFEPQYSRYQEIIKSKVIESSIDFNDNIIVDPYESVIINGWIDYIEDIELQFTAKLVVTGLTSNFYARDIALELIGVKSSQVIGVSDKSITLAIDGTIKASFLLASRTTTKTLNTGIEQQDQFCYNPSRAFNCIKKCFNHFNLTMN